MTTEIKLSDLEHLAPLVDARDWDAVNAALDADHENKTAWIRQVKQNDPKVKYPAIMNDKREAAMDHVLMEAVKHGPYSTVARAVRNMEFNTLTMMQARRYALDHDKRKPLRLLDRLAASFPQELRDIFNHPGGEDLDPRVHERTQADTLMRMRKNSTRKKPGPR